MSDNHAELVLDPQLLMKIEWAQNVADSVMTPVKLDSDRLQELVPGLWHGGMARIMPLPLEVLFKDSAKRVQLSLQKFGTHLGLPDFLTGDVVWNVRAGAVDQVPEIISYPGLMLGGQKEFWALGGNISVATASPPEKITLVVDLDGGGTWTEPSLGQRERMYRCARTVALFCRSLPAGLANQVRLRVGRLDSRRDVLGWANIRDDVAKAAYEEWMEQSDTYNTQCVREFLETLANMNGGILPHVDFGNELGHAGTLLRATLPGGIMPTIADVLGALRQDELWATMLDPEIRTVNKLGDIATVEDLIKTADVVTVLRAARRGLAVVVSPLMPGGLGQVLSFAPKAPVVALLPFPKVYSVTGGQVVLLGMEEHPHHRVRINDPEKYTAYRNGALLKVADVLPYLYAV